MFCYRGQGRLEHRWQVAGRKAIGRRVGEGRPQGPPSDGRPQGRADIVGAV